MKITPKELRQIIKEEYERVISEGRYRQATTYPELYDALKAAIGDYNDEIVKMWRSANPELGCARGGGRLG